MELNINKKELMRLAEAFYKLTKIRIVILDDKFNEIFGYPEEYCKFCELMRKTDSFAKKCDISNKILCSKCEKENRLITGTCHAGLTEAVAPLVKNNITMGYIMFGQIRSIRDKDEFIKKITVLCRECNLCSNKFEAAALSVPYKTAEQISAAAEIINVFISYIYLKEIVNIKNQDTANLIISYIEENLSEDLSINSICKKFLISRTSFYEITKPYMTDGAAAFIRTKRIERAKKLLTSTTMSVEEISEAVGFNDYNYFRRIFKQHTGIPANRYRKERCC